MIDKDKWGKKERIWGLEEYYDPGRALQIYEAIKGKDIFSVIDIACGVGFIAESLSWVMPDADFYQFDIEKYQEWDHLKIRPQVEKLEEFIQKDHHFHLVMMLNSYRNWDEEPRQKLNQWIRRNARYFITSYEGDDPVSDTWKVIGKDVKGHDLKLYTI